MTKWIHLKVMPIGCSAALPPCSAARAAKTKKNGEILQQCDKQDFAVACSSCLSREGPGSKSAARGAQFPQPVARWWRRVLFLRMQLPPRRFFPGFHYRHGFSAFLFQKRRAFIQQFLALGFLLQINLGFRLPSALLRTGVIFSAAAACAASAAFCAPRVRASRSAITSQQRLERK